MTADYEDAVIGGGQAGLTACYYLRRASIPFVILDAHARAGDAWRARWDSLELFTNARYSRLPGLDFPGDQGRFPRKDEVADYIQSYARTHDLPVRPNTRVTSLRAAADGYELETDDGAVSTQSVIVATGAYQQPHVPALSEQLDPRVVQLHSAEYRNPAQLTASDAVSSWVARIPVRTSLRILPQPTASLWREERDCRTCRGGSSGAVCTGGAITWV